MTRTQTEQREKEKQKTARGGRRPGAGRKTRFPGKTEKLTVSLTGEAATKALAIARRDRCTVSDAVEEALRTYPL